MSNYYFLKIKDIERHSEDAVTIHFWHPFNEIIAYKPGQFLTIFVPHEGTKVRRSYSLSSSSFTDISPAITVKRIAGGIASNYLIDKVQVDDILEVMAPMGTFCVEPNEDTTRHLVLVGAGSGITPLLSMIKSVLIVEPESTIHLVYGNRNEESILFADVLAQLQQKYSTRFSIDYILSQPSTSWEGDSGRITKAYLSEKLSTYAPLANAEVYLCGPTGMMEQAQEAFLALGVNSERIKKENFYNQQVVEKLIDQSANDAPKAHTIRLRYEREEYELEVQPHQTVLEAALEKDIDLPYSCQAGMCTACLGKCVAGSVKMDEEEALTKGEIEGGYILTCVTRPISDGVIIEVE